MKRLGQVPINNIQTVTEEVMQKEMESSDSEALLAKSGVVNYLKSRNLYFNSNDVCRCHPLQIVQRKATFLIASVRAKQIQGSISSVLQ